jgi:chromosome segregation protein
MRLNRLEISGFKSFPDRADLAFDRGVTAIVGPNGCGKSNVVDAITWVLGEQSAKSLRGEQMQDVIFSGSDARKPTAAAEVRLRLNDVPTQAARQAASRRDPALAPVTEEAEAAQLELPATDVRDVEIARRLYRSGESEYLLDGEVVRLRDVQDLLMDGGLGFKGYAVIEQGKIGQILSAKPTDRRLLIEEAAGVTKYRSRRRAAELKLEAAQQNLSRVDDVIFELDRQRTSLKRQSAKARRYRRLRDELRRWEKVLYARRYRALAQAIEAARAKLAAARNEESTAVSALVALEQQLDATRREVSAAEARAAAARDLSHARELETERRQQQVTFDREQVGVLGEAIDRLAGELRSLAERTEPARQEFEERQRAAGQADAERLVAADRLAREEASLLEAQRRVQQLEQRLDEARRQGLANSTTIATLHNVIERAGEAAERLAADITRLDGEAGDQRVERQRLTGEREAVARALGEVRQAIADTRSARAAREGALAGARSGRESLRGDLRSRERDAAGLDARSRSLEELEASREGYGEAARAILADAAAGITHFGAVADAIEADPAFERAVEACLGDLLQFVLVASEADARRGLETVRSRNLGRCGFLVVDAPAVRAPSPVEPPAAGLRSLSSVVRVGGPHAGPVRAATGEAWIAETFEVAAEASRVTPVPVVTLLGDVFRSGRLVHGGSRTEVRGLLATKRELKELRERVAADHAAVADMARQLADAEEGVAALEQEVASLGAVLHDHEKTAVGAEVQVRRADDDLDRVARRLELIASERQRAEDERRAQIARQDEARESIATHERTQVELDAAADEALGQLATARDEAANASARVAEVKAAHAALVERALGLANEVRRLQQASQELEERIAERGAEREASILRRREREDAVAEGLRRAADEQQALESARAEVRLADETVSGLQQQFHSLESDARTARSVVDDARAALSQLEVARATAEGDLAHLSSSCADVLQATLDEVAAEVEALEASGEAVPDAAAIYGEEEGEADNEEELAGTLGPAAVDVAAAGEAAATAAVEAERARGLQAHALTAEEAIAELKAKIDRLGPVNMMAIEQFDELEQRHGFLSGQRKDLVDSIAQTGEAIRRIDKTTRERFNDAFTAIQKNFDETFQTLFGGGRSGLVLIDESDVLESGIDIIAQPPGKRLQSVQLLSGGEKALTAMALMFGIFRYRPSPFCLLDEIDAPLDDANIARFIDMLRGMLAHTQFILITHHRKTMEIADRLYGVTMEEPGVSKLISLELN